MEKRKSKGAGPPFVSQRGAPDTRFACGMRVSRWLRTLYILHVVGATSFLNRLQQISLAAGPLLLFYILIAVGSIDPEG